VLFDDNIRRGLMGRLMKMYNIDGGGGVGRTFEVDATGRARNRCCSSSWPLSAGVDWPTCRGVQNVRRINCWCLWAFGAPKLREYKIGVRIFSKSFLCFFSTYALSAELENLPIDVREINTRVDSLMEHSK